MFGFGLLHKVFREIENAARQNIEEEKQQVMARLRALHAQLETGAISEDEFDQAESVQLQRLEQLKRV